MRSESDRLMCSGHEWVPRGGRADAVAVLMSGGVDSSVAAAMLLDAGTDAVGITLQIPSGLGPAVCGAELRACCGTGASEVARALGIPHYFLDVREEFRRFVLEPFRAAYRRGRTPSPCVDCNTWVKFGAAADAIRATLGIERIATGHYARVLRAGAGWGLYRGVDAKKDQSYFLYGLRRAELGRVVFPAGGQTKERTRAAARARGLAVADAAESVELCFAEQGDYRAALGPEPDAGPGDVLDATGRVIGRHRGISRYTIGQREGLGIAAGVPMYVVRIDAGSNTVTLGDRAAATRRRVEAGKLNVLAPEALVRGARLLGRIRHGQGADACAVVEVDESGEAGRAVVEFDEGQFAVTPGQHLVLYTDDGRVVAGGEISDLRFQI